MQPWPNIISQIDDVQSIFARSEPQNQDQVVELRGKKILEVTSSDMTPKNQKQVLGTSHGIAAKGFDPPHVFTSSSNFGFSFLLLLLPVFPP